MLFRSDQVKPLAKRKGPTAKGEKGGKRPFRTWTDASGKFTTKARFLSLDGDEVRLETEAGKTITMKLAKLSDADQAMARKIAARTVKEADAGNPFTEDEQASPGSRPGPRPGHAPDSDPAVTEGDWSECRTVVPAPPEGWSVTMAAPPQEGTLAAKPIALPSNGKSGRDAFFEKVDGLLVADGAPRACVVIHDAPPGRPAETSIVPVDLAKGKAAAAVRWPSSLRPVDVDRKEIGRAHV